MKARRCNYPLKPFENSRSGSMLMGTIVFSAFVATIVMFMLSRQRQSVKVIVEEVRDSQSRRKLSDAGIFISSQLRDDRASFANLYKCLPTPVMTKASDVGLTSDLFKDVQFSCKMPTPLGEFYLRLEVVNTQNFKAASSISVQGSKCRQAFLSFYSDKALPVGTVASLTFDTSLSDKSDHVWSHEWSAGTATGLAANCSDANSTCYRWNGPGTITLKSYCGSAFKTVHFRELGITVLNSGFDKMKELTDIELQENKLVSLPAGVFAGLRNLTTLVMWGNQLGPTLAPDIFHDLVALTSLNLGGNKLRSLSALQFKMPGANPNLLVDLQLGTNLLGIDVVAPSPSLPSDIFSQSRNLIDLNLRENKLETLHEDLFQELSLLRNLGLETNRIGETVPATVALPPRIFRKLNSLVNLNLGGNKLKSLDFEQFKIDGLNPNNIAQITLSSNLLGQGIIAPSPSLPSGLFAETKRLSDLRMRENKIVILPPDIFYGLTALRELDLYGNQITPPLPVDLFRDLGLLNLLHFSHNRLTSPAVDQVLTELTAIGFQGNLEIKQLNGPTPAATPSPAVLATFLGSPPGRTATATHD